MGWPNFLSSLVTKNASWAWWDWDVACISGCDVPLVAGMFFTSVIALEESRGITRNQQEQPKLGEYYTSFLSSSPNGIIIFP